MDKFLVKRTRFDNSSGQSDSSKSQSDADKSSAVETNQTTIISTAPCDTTPVEPSQNVVITPGPSSKPMSACRMYNRIFRPEWATTFNWLNYDQITSRAFCKICTEANNRHFLDNAKLVKPAFIIEGFNDWKHALVRFRGHEKSDCHRLALTKISYVRAGQNVACGLSKAKSEEMVLARSSLHRIVTSLTFLARQGLAIRGKTDDSSNFGQLLKLRSFDVSALQTWLARTKYRWISHDVQNEILTMLSDDVMRRVIIDIKSAHYYSIMVDETTDCSRHEQLVMCIRYVDSDFDIHEVFIGFYELARQDATTLFTVVKDILLRMNIDIQHCRGQCYDGAANVAGSLSGLQTKIRDIEPRALFVHCAAHTLNLVVQDAISSVPAYRDILQTFGTLITYVRDSPKRLRWFEVLQKQDTNALRPYCPTRWVLRESALTSVMSNYTELCSFMDEISEQDKSEVGAKAAGFSNQLDKFSTYFNLASLLKVLTVIGTTNQAMQAATLHLQEANKLLKYLKIQLQSYRNQFEELWITATERIQELGLDQPSVPRYRRAPRRLDDGSDGYVFSSPEAYYRQQYAALIDTALGAVESRYASDTWDFLSDVESALLTKPVQTAVISNFYGSDLNADRLQLHVSMFHDWIEENNKQVCSSQFKNTG